MSNKQPKSRRTRRLRPTPALVVAFVALFAAMGGFGYAAVKVMPNSVRSKSIRAGSGDHRQDRGRCRDHAQAGARRGRPERRVRHERGQAGRRRAGRLSDRLAKASLVVDTDVVTPAQPTAAVPGFNCANKGADAVRIERTDVGRYVVSFAGNDAANAVVTSAGDNAVTAVTKTADGFLVKVWNNSDAAFVDGKSFSLIAF